MPNQAAHHKLFQDPESSIPREQEAAYWIVRNCDDSNELDRYARWITARGDAALFPAVLENPGCRPDHIEAIAGSARITGLIELLIIQHPRMPASVLSRMTGSSSIRVREELARRPDLSSAQARQLATDISTAVRTAVASNPAVAEELRVLAALGPRI